MKRGKRDFKLSNRWLYTFIILGIFAVVGVGVYAAQQASAGGTHNYAEVGIPSCSDGQVLKWSGSAWVCGGLCPAGKVLSYRPQSFGGSVTPNPSTYSSVGVGYDCSHYGVTDTCDGNIHSMYICPSNLAKTCNDYFSLTGISPSCGLNVITCVPDIPASTVDVVVCE
jgi:hypothetical protein